MAEQAWKSLSSTTLKNCWDHAGIQQPPLHTITLTCPCPPIPSDEHHSIEKELLDLVAQLKDWRQINGQPCTLNELLDPEEEREVGENIFAFEGGDAEIVGFVQEEMASDIEEINSDNEDPEGVPPSLKEMLDMCQIIKEHSMVVCTEGLLEVVKALHQYQGHLQRLRHKGEKQVTLDTFFHL